MSGNEELRVAAMSAIQATVLALAMLKNGYDLWKIREGRIRDEASCEVPQLETSALSPIPEIRDDSLVDQDQSFESENKENDENSNIMNERRVKGRKRGEKRKQSAALHGELSCTKPCTLATEHHVGHVERAVIPDAVTIGLKCCIVNAVFIVTMNEVAKRLLDWSAQLLLTVLFSAIWQMRPELLAYVFDEFVTGFIEYIDHTSRPWLRYLLKRAFSFAFRKLGGVLRSTKGLLEVSDLDEITDKMNAFQKTLHEHHRAQYFAELKAAALELPANSSAGPVARPDSAIYSATANQTKQQRSSKSKSFLREFRPSRLSSAI